MDKVESAPEPLLAGDLVDGVPIRGFAFRQGAEVPSSRDDHVLFDSDRDLLEPPDRSVLEVAQSVGSPARLGAPLVSDEWIVAIEEAAPGLPGAVDGLVRDAARPWHPIADTLLTDFQAGRHDLWLVGGSVRDLLLGAADRVRDLDLAGTAPVGHFYEQADQAVAGSGQADLRMKISDGVVSILGTRLADRTVIDYRPLYQDGFRFPASGSDMRIDAARRDLTVNCLFYNCGKQVLLDPTGCGMADLLGGEAPMLAPVPGMKDAAARADVVLRAIRMLIRWTNLSAPHCSVSQQLTLDEETLREIQRRVGHHLGGTSAEQVLEAAGRLGGNDTDLVRRLREFMYE